MEEHWGDMPSAINLNASSYDPERTPSIYASCYHLECNPDICQTLT